MTGRGALALDIRLLDVEVCVHTDEPAAVARLRLWFEPCLYRRPPGRPRDGVVEATIARAADRWRIEVDGKSAREESELARAIAALNHDMLHAVMARRTDLFFVHAAVLAFGDRAVALPGLSRAGKSTLAAALVARGAQLLSDELLAYDPHEARVLAVPRALKIRLVCVPYFPEWEPHLIGETEGRLLPFSALDPGVVRPSAELACVVVPTWSPDGTDELMPLSKGIALLRLTESALNFGVRRAASVDVLAQMIQGASAFTLDWRDPHASAAAIARVFEAGP
jgi:hypothetical protein